MVNTGLIRPYLWGGYLGGGWLISLFCNDLALHSSAKLL